MSLYVCCRAGRNVSHSTHPSDITSAMDRVYADYPGNIHNSIANQSFSVISRSTPVFDDNRNFEGVFYLEPKYLIVTGYARVDYRLDVLKHFDIKHADQWSDEKLVAFIWATFGTKALDVVAGDYSVVVFNPESHEVHIIRSAMGNYACFYFLCANSGMCLVSSTLLPILNNRFESLDPNLDYLVMSCMGLHTSIRGSSETQWKNVFSASAGSVTTISADNSVQSERFWYPEHLRPLHYPHQNDYFEHFLELYHDAIHQRLHPQANHGGFMSGGFDSSSVSVIAHKHLQKMGKSYKAFTSIPAYPESVITYKGKMSDESMMVNYMLRDHPEMLHQYVKSEHFGPLDAMKLDMQSNGMFTMNFQNNYWLYETYRLANKSGIQILLNGNLGNLTLSWDGYDVYKGYLLQAKYGSFVCDLLSNSIHGKANPLRTMWTDFRKTMTQGDHVTLEYLLKKSESNLSRKIESLQHPFDVREVCEEIDSLFSEKVFTHGLPNTFNMKYRWFVLVMKSVRTNNLDHLAKLGVEMRDPTVDKRVSEFCFRMPLSMFYRKGVRRYFARNVFKGILPDELIANTDRGHQAADIRHRVKLQLPEIEKELAKPLRMLPFQVKLDDALQKIDQLKKESGATVSQNEVVGSILGTVSLFVQDEYMQNCIK